MRPKRIETLNSGIPEQTMVCNFPIWLPDFRAILLQFQLEPNRKNHTSYLDKNPLTLPLALATVLWHTPLYQPPCKA